MLSLLITSVIDPLKVNLNEFEMILEYDSKYDDEVQTPHERPYSLMYQHFLLIKTLSIVQTKQIF